jgi:hypothetical protein
MVKATLLKKDSATTKPADLTPAQKADAIPVESSSLEDLQEEVNAGSTTVAVPADAAQAAQEPQKQVTAVAVREKASVPATRPAQSSGPSSAVEGEFDDSDLKFPRLQIVNGSGKLAQQYNQGCVLYADELLFETPPTTKAGPGFTPPLSFIPLMLKKQYREILPQDAQESGEMPRIFDTKEEVEAVGGRLIEFDGEEANWKPMARCLFLLEQPEGCDHPGFLTQLDGKYYAPAVYYAGGMAYSRVAKPLFNNFSTVLKVPAINPDGTPKKDASNRTIWTPMLHRFVWTFQVGKVVGKTFTTFQPTIRMTKVESGPEVCQFTEDLTASKDKAIVDGAED